MQTPARDLSDLIPGKPRLQSALGQPLTALILIALLLTLFVASAQPALAHQALAPTLTYSCGNSGTSSPHCYGTYWFPRITNHGSSTTILMSKLTCNPTYCANGKGFIDDEMWLCDDTTGHSCDYWVEGGYWTNYAATGNDYFWADKRPGSGLIVHDLGGVPADDFGGYTTLDITTDGPDTWQIQFYTYTQGDPSGYSTGNTMTANRPQIGQELAGTSGASAPNVLFEDNGYETTANHFVYQTNGSDNYPYEFFDLTGPEHASWFVPPEDSSTGGILETSCC